MPLCSLTCTTTYFFVPDPLIRYTLSQRNKFVTNPDGSVDSYFASGIAGRGEGAWSLTGAAALPLAVIAVDCFFPVVAISLYRPADAVRPFKLRFAQDLMRDLQLCPE